MNHEMVPCNRCNAANGKEECPTCFGIGTIRVQFLKANKPYDYDTNQKYGLYYPARNGGSEVKDAFKTMPTLDGQNAQERYVMKHASCSQWTAARALYATNNDPIKATNLIILDDDTKK